MAVIPYQTGWVSAPAADAFAITPSDTVNFTVLARGIYVGGAGNVVVITQQGTQVTFNGAIAGSVIPIMCSRVNNTNTTATNLVGMV